ncbi:MAG: FAD-binding protein [Clostridiales bacterium]|jgi:electron transfer flavoprotein alpha subunit/electron transfer flavoprotein alpha/beta subunit|nr:FAD-binding protein [Clostridiales bacterium]
MIDIWVCFKAAPDFDQALPEDWNGFSLDTDLGYCGTPLSCFDEAALETALRLKEGFVLDNKKDQIKINALTLAPSLASTIVRALYAAGFDEVIRLDCKVELNPLETAKRLSNFLESRNAHAILCGAQAGYGDSGLVPYMLANALGIEMAANAASVCWPEIGKGGNERLSFLVKADGGEISQLDAPCLISIKNSPLALRQSTLKAQLGAGKKKALIESVLPYEERRTFLFCQEKSERKAQRVDCKGIQSEIQAEKLLDLVEEALSIKDAAVGKKAETSRAGTAVLLLGPDPGMDQALARVWGLAEGCEKAEIWAQCDMDEALLLQWPEGVETVRLVDDLSQISLNPEMDFLVADGSVAATKAAVAFAMRNEWQIESGVLETKSVDFEAKSEAYESWDLKSKSQSSGEKFAVSRACSSYVKLQTPLKPKHVLVASPQARKAAVAETSKPNIVNMRRGDKKPSEIAINTKPSPEVLLVGGAGLGSAKAFESLKKLAELMGGDVGLTRAAAMAGYGSMELVIGQSGRSASPKACVVFGSSGASAFMSGIEGAGTVIAVNISPEAAVFDKADYGFEADAPSLVQTLIKAVSRRSA